MSSRVWKWIKRQTLIAFLMVSIMMSPILLVQADETSFDGNQKGKLTITYEFSQIPFRVFKVADVSEEMKFTWTEEFEDNIVYLEGMDSDVWRNAAQALSAYVTGAKIEPYSCQMTNESGWVCFEGLDTGLYLIMASSHEQNGRKYEIMPILLVLPFCTSDGKWEYEVTTKAKYESSEITKKPITVGVVKLWKDEKNSGIRPSEIKVLLYENGIQKEEVVLNAANGWRYQWDNLDASSEWKVMESDVPEHYQVQIDKEGNVFAITNVYVLPDDKPGDGGDEPVVKPDNGEDEPTDAPDEGKDESADNPDDEEEEPSEEPGREEDESDGETEGKKDKLPQTGQLWWPVPMIGVLGMWLLLYGVKRERRYHEKE